MLWVASLGLLDLIAEVGHLDVGKMATAVGTIPAFRTRLTAFGGTRRPRTPGKIAASFAA